MARFVVRQGSSQIGDCSLSQFYLVTINELLFSNNLAQLREYQVHRYLGVFRAAFLPIYTFLRSKHFNNSPHLLL